MLVKEKLFIGGRWVAPKAGGTIEVVSPDTEKVVAVVAEATAELLQVGYR